ncbi:hypothetical protein Tco_0416068 [Tanacetum coccineum]
MVRWGDNGVGGVGLRWWRWLWRDDGSGVRMMMVKVACRGDVGVGLPWWCRGWRASAAVGVVGWCVTARDMGDLVDLETRKLFGFGRKSPPENFSGGDAVVPGGG